MSYRWQRVALSLFALTFLVAPKLHLDRFDTVVIDAGHGGDDTGARGPKGVLEKDVVLDVSQRLARRLEAEGLRVVLTRGDDRFVTLDGRTAVANDSRGDLFLSIHANAAPNRKVRGVETFFLSLQATDEDAGEIARQENQALGVAAPAAPAGDDSLLDILGDLISTQHMSESNEFARMAQKELSRLDRTASRGVKQAPFTVLMGVKMPAALVEIGFISNPSEERILSSARRRGQLADALARAVHQFGRRYDARRGIQVDSAAAGGGR